MRPPTSAPVPSFDVSKADAPPKEANETMKPIMKRESDTKKKLRSKKASAEAGETAVDSESLKPDTAIVPPPQPLPKPSFDTTLTPKDSRDQEKKERQLQSGIKQRHGPDEVTAPSEKYGDKGIADASHETTTGIDYTQEHMKNTTGATGGRPENSGVDYTDKETAQDSLAAKSRASAIQKNATANVSSVAQQQLEIEHQMEQMRKEREEIQKAKEELIKQKEEILQKRVEKMVDEKRREMRREQELKE